MTTERWWAPQRATVEPDAVVLAMLEPGDFGSAILATHRAGAAAIETVSKGALPSEERLTTAMGTARSNVSDAIVDAIAKSVPSTTYAALLMRDVFDDAETAAVNLYRTAVNKGVTPSVAAQRAGLVYGVPAHELGKYPTVATDPKASPAAVTEAADRVLMTYVSKLAAQEVVDGEVVEVSKAPTGEYRDIPTVSAGWQEREHPRGPEGQFVRKPPGGELPTTYEDPIPRAGSLAWLRQQMGLGARPSAPSRVADIETPPAPTTTPTPTRRRQAQARTGRTGRTGRQIEPRQVSQQTAQRPQAQHRQASRKQLARQEQRTARLQAVARAINPKLPTPGTDLVPVDAIPDLLQRHTDADMDSYDLGAPFTVTVTQRDSNSFRNKMADQAGLLRDPSMRVFRMGYLLDLGMGPEPSLSPEAQAIRRHAAESEQAKLKEYVAPVHEVVHPGDINGVEEHEQLYLAKRRAERATRQVFDRDGIPRDVVDEDELNWVYVMQTYTPYGTATIDEEGRPTQRPEWAIVHFQVNDPQLPDARDIPTVEEYVLDRGARGVEEGTGRHIEYDLDPNQAYEIVAPPGTRRGSRISPQIFWDERNEVVVNRWYIRPVADAEIGYQTGDDTIGKANLPFYQPYPDGPNRPWVEAEVVRDSRGRFADEPDTAPAPTQHKPSRRRQAQARQGRQGRIGRQVQRQPSAQTSGQQAQRAQAGRAQISRAQAGRAQMTPQQQAIARAIDRVFVDDALAAMNEQGNLHQNLPLLDGQDNYQVLTARQWAAVQAALPPANDDGIPVGAQAWNLLSSHDMHDGSGVVAALNTNVESEINDKEGPAQRGYVWTRKNVGRGPLRNENDHFKMSADIQRIFKTNEQIAQIHIDYVSHPGEYLLYANKEPVGDQVLIEHDPDLDLDKPLVLVPLGRVESREMMHRRTDLPGEPLVSLQYEDPTPVNARMEQFRLQNAMVRRYRLQNDDDGYTREERRPPPVL